jgi:hypothetical protein
MCLRASHPRLQAGGGTVSFSFRNEREIHEHDAVLFDDAGRRMIPVIPITERSMGPAAVPATRRCRPIAASK